MPLAHKLKFSNCIIAIWKTTESFDDLKKETDISDIYTFKSEKRKKEILSRNILLNEMIPEAELSYNNFLDIDSAVNLISEFNDDSPTFAILKHNNACGLSTRNSVLAAYKDALAGDPISAFGGVLITNSLIDYESANEINKLFCEVVIAPNFNKDALNLLKSKN